jgi:hypothetical protein
MSKAINYAENRANSRANGLEHTPGAEPGCTKLEGYVNGKVTSGQGEASVAIDLLSYGYGVLTFPLPAYRHTPKVPFATGEVIGLRIRVCDSVATGKPVVQVHHVESELDPEGLGTSVSWYPVDAVVSTF